MQDEKLVKGGFIKPSVLGDDQIAAFVYGDVIGGEHIGNYPSEEAAIAAIDRWRASRVLSEAMGDTPEGEWLTKLREQLGHVNVAYRQNNITEYRRRAENFRAVVRKWYEQSDKKEAKQ